MATFYTGNTGRSTADHLDFRVWDVNKGAYTDPSRFTSRMRVGDGLLTDQFPVTSAYGMREHPVLGGQRMHHGIDYGTPTGTPVTIEGGKFLTTFNDSGGGITSQYAITDEAGNPFEILLMHGSDQNTVLSDAARTDGVATSQPTGAEPSVSDPNPGETTVLSPSAINAEYDRMRMAGDALGARNYGMEQHRRLFNK